MKNITIKIISGFLWILFFLNIIPVFANRNLILSKNSKEILAPLRIAQLPSGDLLVSDHKLRSILTVNKKSLKVISSFEIEGKPLGLAYSTGFVYVGNTQKGLVEVYNRAGRKMRTIGKYMSIKRPTDMAIDSKDKKLFVVDGDDRSVKIFNLNGKIILTIPGPTTGTKPLENPTGITLDRSKKMIFVSDYGRDYGDRDKNVDPRIQVFNYSGKYLRTYENTVLSSTTNSSNDLSKPTMGMGWGEKSRFSRPQGLAINDNFLFVLDCYSAEIQVFDRISGILVKTLGGYGTEPGKMRLPLDLVLNTDNGDIYVTNNRLARIELFPAGGIIK